MNDEKIKYFYSKNDNPNKVNFKRKDSKQTKVILLLKDYFQKHNLLTKDKFDEFLKFIDLKTIWKTKQEQIYLWSSLITYSKSKTSINYESALKGIMELFKSDDDEKKSNNLKDNYSMEDINKTFDKYLKSLNGNQEYLYNIEFINYIFFDKNSTIINNNYIDNIISEIKSKYRFITINEKEIKAYFNCFKSKNISKDLINNVNVLIENLIDQRRNSYSIIFNDSGNNSRSISFSTSANDTNSNKSNNKSSELFDKLLSLDKIILDIIESLNYFTKNNNLINSIKKYIQNYLYLTKNNIYNNLKILIENENKRKTSDSKISIQNEENNNNIIDNNNNINNINYNSKTIEVGMQKSKCLLKKDKKELKPEKSYTNIINIKNKKINSNKNIINSIEFEDNNNDNNINDTNDNNDNIENDNIDNDNDNDNNKSNNIINDDISDENNLKKALLYKKVKHNRNKTDMQGILYSKKLKKNISHANLIKITQKQDIPFNISNKTKNLSRNNCCYLTENKTAMTQRDDDSNSFNEGSIEDLNGFTFSENGNLLLQTENMGNLENIDEDNIIEKGTPTLNPFSSIDCDYYYENYYNENNNNEKNQKKEKHKLSRCQNPNNFTFGKDDNNNENAIKINISGDIDSGIPNYMNNNSFTPLSNQNNKKFIKMGYYDFKYLYKNNNIKKLFSQNNDKMNPIKFLSDEIYIIPSIGLKKQKSILVMSESYLYLLKANSKLTFISKTNNKLIKSVSISSRNCNLILFTFEKASDIIIETYRRMEILKFIKDVLNEKKIKINISHNSAIIKKYGENDSTNLKKAKIITYSPNFENAQKFGILYKYHEYFFSAKFTEKLVVLCCLGLIYFEENERIPKAIIPIIGTSIKSLTVKGVQGSETYYCFQLKTINDEIHIFGSQTKIEIFDWIREFLLFKKKYLSKLKEIEPSLEFHEKNKFYKQK